MKRQLPYHGWRVFFYLPLLLSSCLAQPTAQSTPTPTAPLVISPEENAYAPKPEDLSKQRAEVTLTSLDLSNSTDTTPLRTQLTILGSMPSVCNELRINVSPPSDAYQINIEIYSIVNPNIKCDDVFQQFETSILLGVYSTGEYSVWVNGSFVGNAVSY